MDLFNLILVVAVFPAALSYLVIDFFRFTKAIAKVFSGRVSDEEWFAEPNRKGFGSGFRLHAKFKDR